MTHALKSPRRRHLLACGLGLSMPLLGQAQTAAPSNTIVIGMVRPLTGPLKGVAEGYLETVRATFESVNAQGGLGGAKLELLALDDQGDPTRTAAQTKVLAGNAAVMAVLGIAGTGNVLAASPILTEAKLPLVGPFSGTEALRSAQHKQIFHIRASYDDEVESLVGTMVARHPTGKVVVLFQDDPFGAGAMGTFIRAASGTAPQMKVGTFKFDRVTGELAEADQAQAAIKGADAVMLVAAPRSAAKLLGLVRGLSRNSSVYALSVVDAVGLVKDAGVANAAGVMITQVMPNPKKSNAKLVREYRSVIEKTGLAPNFAGMEGYVAARVLLEALKSVKPGALSREKVYSALEDLGRRDLGGFTIQYGKGAHNGSRFVDLSMISPSGSIID